MACHNGLRTPAGEDVSIGASWRASMMANSSRDPYWQAAVRREVIDHPAASDAIQDECATCHMPMSRTRGSSRQEKRAGIFEHLPAHAKVDRRDRLAHDGVACSLCHQITDRNLGTPASFTGGFVVSAGGDAGTAPDVRAVSNRARDIDDHALGNGVSADRGAAREAVRALRDLPYARHQSTRPKRRDHRRAARADAVSRVEEQRVCRRAAQLPVMPYARGRGGHADCLGARRSAQRFCAPHICRWQFLHAADAEPVSRRAASDGASRRDGCGCRHHACESADSDRRGFRRACRSRERQASGGCRRAQPDGSQVADRLSIATRMASRRGSRS